MLRHAVRVTQRAVSQQRACKSSWACAVPKRKVLSDLRQRRPLVNGEAVAFHINDFSLPSYHNDNTSLPAPKAKTYESDLVVILDMDECLIHSQFIGNASQQYAYQIQRQQQQRLSKPLVETFHVTLPAGDNVRVHLRPGVREFLRKVTQRYETHIYTASVPVYANPVLDRLGCDFAGRWYRHHCQNLGNRVYVKDLTTLPFVDDLSRVVLVDNNPLSFLRNPHNGILVKNFYDDASDDSLASVWDILQELEEHDNVQPLLKRRFKLDECLQEHIQKLDDLGVHGWNQ